MRSRGLLWTLLALILVAGCAAHATASRDPKRGIASSRYLSSDPLAVAYMRKLFPMLDALPFVQRYAWFTDDCWSDAGCRYGSLFNGRGQETATGRAFTTAG